MPRVSGLCSIEWRLTRWRKCYLDQIRTEAWFWRFAVGTPSRRSQLLLWYLAYRAVNILAVVGQPYAYFSKTSGHVFVKLYPLSIPCQIFACIHHLWARLTRYRDCNSIEIHAVSLCPSIVISLRTYTSYPTFIRSVPFRARSVSPHVPIPVPGLPSATLYYLAQR